MVKAGTAWRITVFYKVVAAGATSCQIDHDTFSLIWRPFCFISVILFVFFFSVLILGFFSVLSDFYQKFPSRA